MRLIASLLLLCSIGFSPALVQAVEVNPNAPVRTSKEIQDAFNTIKEDVTKIIDAKRKRDPEVSGKIEYKVTVEADGVVSEVLVENSTLKDAKVEQGILEKIEKLDFGKASGRAEKMTFSFPIDIPHKDAKPAAGPPMKIETKPFTM